MNTIGKDMKSWPPLLLRGNPFEIGYALGAMFKTRIAEYVQKRWRTLCDFEDEESWLSLARSSLAIARKFAPMSYSELQGVSKGADVDLGKSFLVIGYTDAVDFARDRIQHD